MANATGGAYNTRNIIVGAARLFLSGGNGINRPDLSSSAVLPFGYMNQGTNTSTSTASTTSAIQSLVGTASTFWRDLGYTNNGLEVSYEPTYSDVMVDQLLDAARLFRQQVKVVLKTEMTEGTLENLHFALGQQDSYLAYKQDGTSQAVQTFSVTDTGSKSVLSLNGSSLGDSAIDRTIVAVGNAPGFMGATYNPAIQTSAASGTGYTSGSVGTGTTLDASGRQKKERVYIARKIVQVETVAHALKRDAVTVFPVNFRCLPDADRDDADGSEYGFIIDRVYGT
jgi:hypothetical protein